MAVAMWTLWLGLGVYCLLVHARLPRCCEMGKSEAGTGAAMNAMLAEVPCTEATVFVLTDRSAWASSVLKGVSEFAAPYGVSLFEVESEGEDVNATHKQLRRFMADGVQLRKELHCVTVVVVSDDPVFLSSFAESAFRSHLLQVQTTRLLAFTHLPLHRLHTLHHLHKTLSRTNSLIAVISNTPFRIAVYYMLPYSHPDTWPLRVAIWTAARGLVLTSSTQLFINKFLKYPHGPHLLVTGEELPDQKAIMVDDPTAPGGKRLTFRGPMDDVMRVISKHMNLTYSYIRAEDRTWGVLLSDGSWTGMLGLLMNEEVELALGPFGMISDRNYWMDFTQYLTLTGFRVLAARGRPEVDPWGFLLPLSPLVWAAVATALFTVIIAMLILPSCLPIHTQHAARHWAKGFSCVRVLLQQDVEDAAGCGWWWWERVVVGVWMMMMLVMTRSYAGNLMSLLAVRHIPQPYQSLRDVLDDTIKLIIQKDNANTVYYKTAKSGIFREMGDLLNTDRMVLHNFFEFEDSVDKLVRRGTHTLFDAEFNLINMMAKDFSKTGRCDFYYSRSVYLSYIVAMMGQKNSPLIPGLNKVVSSLVESGTFEKWLRFSLPNSTTCLNQPTTITVNTVLSFTSLWGMFAVLVGGHALGLLLLLLEKLVPPLKAKARLQSNH